MTHLKKGKKMKDKKVQVGAQDALEVADAMERLRKTNILLFELLDETLEANSKLVKVLVEVYPSINLMDRAETVLNTILEVYGVDGFKKKEEKEAALKRLREEEPLEDERK